MQNVCTSDFSRNQFFAVYAVHKAHNCSVLSCNHADTVHCAWKRSIFQSNDQQVCSSSFLWCPYFRMVGHTINHAAFFHSFCTFTLCNNSQSDIFPSGKSPYHIRTNCSCTKNCNCFYLHLFNSPLLNFYFPYCRNKYSPLNIFARKNYNILLSESQFYFLILL